MKCNLVYARVSMDTHYKVINKTLGEQEKQEFLKRLEHIDRKSVV